MLNVVLYSCGDSRDINTWSNVPFFFAQEMERRGIILHRVNIAPNPLLNKIFNTFSFYLFQKLFRCKSCPVYARLWLHRFLTRFKLKYAARKWPNANFHLFLSYAFYNPYTSTPSVLWCDWPDAMVIQRLHRKSKWYETGFLAHERHVIQNAAAVYSMFPKCAERMSQDYGRKVHWLARNIVNNRFDGEINPQRYVEERVKSNRILFVGNHLYLDAAEKLLKSVQCLHAQGEDVELHFIGLKLEQFQTDLPSYVVCHGYLHKDIPAERSEYYFLFRTAKVLCNPAQWGAYSSLVEAMFWGIPVLVAPFEDFVAEFGEEIDFGYYLHLEDELVPKLKKIISLSKDEYARFSQNARDRVSDYTWENYVSAFLHSLSWNELSDNGNNVLKNWR